MNPLMTHIVAGYPDLKKSEQIAEVMLEAGVAYLEIQIPFSDPVADGSTIMRANQTALEEGTSVEDCFQMMERLSKKSDTPLLFMTYFNIPFRYGLEKFCRRAQQAGCYGFIIPDIPLDEEPFDQYLETCKKYDLHPVQVVSPITPDRRLKKIGQVASGLVYCVSRTGTTGTRSEMESGLKSYLDRVRRHVAIPLALGFGISERKHVEQALKVADIAVMGSAVIQQVDKNPSLPALKKFLRGLID